MSNKIKSNIKKSAYNYLYSDFYSEEAILLKEFLRNVSIEYLENLIQLITLVFLALHIFNSKMLPNKPLRPRNSKSGYNADLL